MLWCQKSPWTTYSIESCHKTGNYAETMVIFLSVLVRKEIFLVLILPVRIPALWNYFVVPKVLQSPSGFPEVTSPAPLWERSGRRIEKPLLMGKPLCSCLGFPRSGVRESSLDGISCCSLTHVTWIHKETWPFSCSTVENPKRLLTQYLWSWWKGSWGYTATQHSHRLPKQRHWHFATSHFYL